MGLLDECVEDFNECLRLDPGRYNAAYALGACENKRGNYDKAIEVYNLAFEKERRANSPQRRISLDRIQYLLGPLPARGRSLFRPASSSGFYSAASRTPRTRASVALPAAKDSDSSEVAHGPSARRRLSHDSAACALLGPLAVQTRDFSRFLTVASPTESSVSTGQENTKTAGTVESAVSAKSQSRPDETTVNASPGRKAEAEKLHALGYEAKKRGDFAEAVSLYSKAIEASPGYLKAYFNRGFAFDKLGEYAKAIEDYTRVVELDPRNAYALYNRGIALQKLMRLDEAVADFTKAIAIMPEKADFYHNRGFAYRKKRDLERAVKDYGEAIRIDPSHFKVRVSL